MQHPHRRRRECFDSHGLRTAHRCGSGGLCATEPRQNGGITELCKVFPIAAVSNIAVMPHSFYDGPGLLAAIHTTAALGTADSMIEWRCFDLEAQIYGGVLAPQRGRIAVPQSPSRG